MLYFAVAGGEPSADFGRVIFERAIAAARELCDVHLAGRSHLRVVDVHEESDVGLRVGILATPTLVRDAPLPVRKVVGDLSDMRKVLRAVQVRVDNDLLRERITPEVRAALAR